MQQAEFQSQKVKAGLKVLTLNGLLVIHLTQAIMLMLRSQAILAGHSLTTHLSEDILIVGEQTAVGLAAGTYDMKVVPMKNGSEVTADAITATGLTVQAHDRAGAAFSPKSTYKGAGAYNADGTLKAGAKVILCYTCYLLKL